MAWLPAWSHDRERDGTASEMQIVTQSAAQSGRGQYALLPLSLPAVPQSRDFFVLPLLRDEKTRSSASNREHLPGWVEVWVGPMRFYCILGTLQSSPSVSSPTFNPISKVT